MKCTCAAIDHDHSNRKAGFAPCQRTPVIQGGVCTICRNWYSMPERRPVQ